MSIMAGAVSRMLDEPLPKDLCEAVCSGLSREGRGVILTHKSARACLAKVDFRIFRSSGWLADGGGNVTVLVGEPFLYTDEVEGD